jgi:hypothetical protein
VIVADGTCTGTGNRDIDFGGKAITVRSQNGPRTIKKSSDAKFLGNLTLFC